MSTLPSTSLRARAAFVIARVLWLLLAAGCRSYGTGEFVATDYPVTVENGRTAGQCGVPLAFPPTADVSSTTGWP